jgi:hypothetical protein
LARVQDSLLTALYAPKLAARAAAVLAHVGTPEVQRALVEWAGRSGQPIEDRVAAAQAFQLNRKKHGVLLDRGEITRQYERYHRSAPQDDATRRIAGMILEGLEKPTLRKK